MSTFLSRIIAFIPVLLASVAGIVSIVNQIRLPEDQISTGYRNVLLGLLVLIVIVAIGYLGLVLRYEKTAKFLVDRSKRKQIKKAPYIFNSIRVRIEYLDENGTDVSFRSSAHITKIKQKHIVVDSDFDSDGTILSFESINSTLNKLNDRALSITNHLNQNTMVNGEYYSDYHILVHDGFSKTTEFWKYSVKSYCVFHEIQVIIPKTRILKDVKLHHKAATSDAEKDAIYNDNNWNAWPHYSKPAILQIRRYNCSVLCVQLTGLTSYDVFALTWTVG